MTIKDRSPKHQRNCEKCSACCTALRIDFKPGYSTRTDTGEDISKKSGVPCRFLNETGCGIYEVRPLLCRQFKCDWLQYRKGFTDDDAPIKIGRFSARGKIFILPD